MARYQSKASHRYREPPVEFYADDGKAIVLLDLETSGLHMNCEVLQIAAKYSGRESFSAYINPVRSIPERVTLLNGLSTCQGRLMLHGVPVPTMSMNAALRGLHNWLRSLGKHCYIATHNLSFDGPRLLKAITEHFSRKKFAQVIHGFIDTLRVIRNVTGWKGQCKLTDLAEQYDISTTGMHNAVHDCEILEQILYELGITKAILLENSKDFALQTQLWDTQERNRRTLATLAPLRRTVKLPVLKKLARADIDMGALKCCYNQCGSAGIFEFLETEIESQSLERMSDMSIQKIVDAVLDYCE